MLHIRSAHNCEGLMIDWSLNQHFNMIKIVVVVVSLETYNCTVVYGNWSKGSEHSITALISTFTDQSTEHDQGLIIYVNC